MVVGRIRQYKARQVSLYQLINRGNSNLTHRMIGEGYVQCAHVATWTCNNEYLLKRRESELSQLVLLCCLALFDVNTHMYTGTVKVHVFHSMWLLP